MQYQLFGKFHKFDPYTFSASDRIIRCIQTRYFLTQKASTSNFNLNHQKIASVAIVNKIINRKKEIIIAQP